jgi:hypothetical protein
MKRISTLLLVIIAAGLLTGQGKSSESTLGAALHKEEVERDFKGAIASYNKLLVVRGLDRKIAAEALFHLGLCYQKLGDVEARKTFERLVNEFGDTSWAHQARPKYWPCRVGFQWIVKQRRCCGSPISIVKGPFRQMGALSPTRIGKPETWHFTIW